MSQKVYVDTNVFMDFLLNRHEINFFEEAVKCKYVVLISQLVLDELAYQKVDATNLCSWLSYAQKIEVVSLGTSHRKLAQTFLSQTHTNDALHAAVAILCGADFLVTRNIKDFAQLPITVIHPDNI